MQTRSVQTILCTLSMPLWDKRDADLACAVVVWEVAALTRPATAQHMQIAHLKLPTSKCPVLLACNQCVEPEPEALAVGLLPL